jgi:hypothetical protein
LFGILIGLVVFFIFSLIALMALIRFARTDNFWEAFNFSAIVAHIGKIGWVSYILASPNTGPWEVSPLGRGQEAPSPLSLWAQYAVSPARGRVEKNCKEREEGQKYPQKISRMYD